MESLTSFEVHTSCVNGHSTCLTSIRHTELQLQRQNLTNWEVRSASTGTYMLGVDWTHRMTDVKAGQQKYFFVSIGTLMRGAD